MNFDEELSFRDDPDKLAAVRAQRDALAAELAISKGREEAKQLVINQLEAALREVMAASFSQDSAHKIAERALPRSKVTAAQSDRGEKR